MPICSVYAAYGSNLNLRQMANRCPGAKIIGHGFLLDYRLLFRGRSSGVATVERCVGHKVPVLIWAITEDDEHELDRYEGYPHLYHKEWLPVKLKLGTAHAMFYVMNGGYDFAPPSEYYLRTIGEGYSSSKFDHAVLREACAYTLSFID